MGGSKPKTIGYRYFLGIHLGLCQQADYISRIRFGDKTAWTGQAQDSSVTLNSPTLFGGSNSEGGVSGTVNVESGASTQAASTYLSSVQTGNFPGNRGLCGLVFNQCYIGNNPRGLSQINVTASKTTSDWYPEASEIPTIQPGDSCSWLRLAIVIDNKTDSGSLGRLSRFKSDAISVLQAVKASEIATKDILVRTPQNVGLTFTSASPANIDAAIAYVQGLTTEAAFPTDMATAIAAVSSFFPAYSGSRKNLFQIYSAGFLASDYSSGAIFAGTTPFIGNNTVKTSIYQHQRGRTYQLATLGDVFNTVPGMPSLGLSIDYYNIFTPVVKYPSQNPAHVLYRMLTDESSGLGISPGDLDLASFSSAADLFRAERLGLSFAWEDPGEVGEVISDVLRHAEAVLFIDRETGKFKLKALRPETAAVSLTEDDIIEVTDFRRPPQKELITSVVVKYNDLVNVRTSQVRFEDPGLSDFQGSRQEKSYDYSYFTDSGQASDAAIRLLRKVAAPRASAAITVTEAVGSDVNLGDVVNVSWPRLGISEPFRVVEVNYGDDADRRVELKLEEESFKTASNAPGAGAATNFSAPGRDPADLLEAVIFETPYYELCQRFAQSNVDTTLADAPEIGYVSALCAVSSGNINARVNVDSGAGYVQGDTFEFCPVATLTSAVDQTATTFNVGMFKGYDLVIPGTIAQIGDELVYVTAKTATTLTVKRGVLDTTPKPHATGKVYFWDLYSGVFPDQFVLGENIDVKLTELTGRGELDLSEASVRSITMAQRAIRPYAPGNLRVNGTAFPSGNTTALAITWAHRDRKQQTSYEVYGYPDASIGPEVGTTYSMTLVDYLGRTVATVTGLTGTSHTFANSLIPANGDKVTLTAFSTRDGYQSWQSVVAELKLFYLPGVGVNFAMTTTGGTTPGTGVNFVM